MKVNIFTKIILSSALFSVAGGASAAAFQLAEVSSSGLGRAFSGEAAIAENASVVATNPALMTMFKNKQFSVGGIYVDSRIHLKGKVELGVGSDTNLMQVDGSNNNVVPGALVPNLYFVAPINDRFALGAGMNVNFGLKSEYKKDYSAGVFGGTTELGTVNFNISGAYRVTKGLSFGLGLNAVYAGAKVERTAGILSDVLKLQDKKIAGRDGRYEQLAKLEKEYEEKVKLLDRITEVERKKDLVAQLESYKKGIENAHFVINTAKEVQGKEHVVTRLEDKNAWGFGWNAGLVYEFNERNRVGLAYHSKVDIDFRDRNALSYAPSATKTTEEFIRDHRIAVIGSGGLTLNLPAYWEISGFHQLTDRFAVSYSYKYTQWNRFKKLHAKYDDGKEAFSKNENYRNNSRLGLGVSYDVNDNLRLRAGIAYDEAAAESHPSASIPDTDRTWFSLGATYKITPNLSVDAGFAHLRGKKVNFIEQQFFAGGVANIKATYQSTAKANLYGLNLNYSF
ncbi:porin [Seminibacterium arietis]|uniref:Porin n=1 Tax=Seminibacterium arietis TaxID=1173502 RepID=A0ABW3I8S1_9PAST